MTSIRKDIPVERDAATVWAAFRDFGAVHDKLARGFVTDTRLDGDARIVTFANGVVARERLVDMDDAARRLAYSIVGGADGALTHHNASFQVFDNGADGCRVVWIADILPNEFADRIGGMMEQGAAAMQRTLRRAG